MCGLRPEHAGLTVVDWQVAIRSTGTYDIGYFASQTTASACDLLNQQESSDTFLMLPLGALTGGALAMLRQAGMEVSTAA